MNKTILLLVVLLAVGISFICATHVSVDVNVGEEACKGIPQTFAEVRAEAIRMSTIESAGVDQTDPHLEEQDFDDDDDSSMHSLSAAGGCGEAAVSHGSAWVSARLKYCGGANGGRDAICRGTCRRQSNPAWDRYRSDCSGYVSFSWGLPPPGDTTKTVMGHAHRVSCNDLKPGDALLSSRHIILFEKWINKASKTAQISEEPGCNKVATRSQTTITCSGQSARLSGRSSGFTSIRKNGC
jgi:hypothetical protein